MMGRMRTFVTDRHTDGADYIGPAGGQGGSNKVIKKCLKKTKKKKKSK